MNVLELVRWMRPDSMSRRSWGTPVAAGCWERPWLSFRLCCNMRVKMVVMAADSALAPYDITCTVSPPQLSLRAWWHNIYTLQQSIGRVYCNDTFSKRSHRTVDVQLSRRAINITHCTFNVPHCDRMQRISFCAAADIVHSLTHLGPGKCLADAILGPP